MSVQGYKWYIHLEDIEQSAAGTTETGPAISVSGTSTTATRTDFNASNFPVLATASAAKVTAAGGAATYPGPAIGELADRIRVYAADVAAAQAIATQPVAGQLLWVESIKRLFGWDNDDTSAHDGTSVIKVTAITTGRWLATTASAADSVTLSSLPYPFAEFDAVGDLNAMVGSYIGYCYLPKAATLSYVQVYAPTTAAAGTLEVDILKSDTDGAAFTSLYSVATKPQITCNSTDQRTSQSGGTLPDTTSLPAGTVVGVKITSAPVGCVDLKVQLY